MRRLALLVSIGVASLSLTRSARAADESQIFEKHSRNYESPQHFAFELPAVPVELTGHYEDRVVRAAPSLDTLLIEPSLGVVEITLRHAFAMGRGKRMLREVRVNHG